MAPKAGRSPSKDAGETHIPAGNSDINHRNAQGNTPLHFAMAYDSEGTLAEYLIQQGADDTIENNVGCTCYDGIGG